MTIRFRAAWLATMAVALALAALAWHEVAAGSGGGAAALAAVPRSITAALANASPAALPHEIRAVAAPASPGAAAQAAPLTVFMSWDGTPSWLVEKLLAEGGLPNVARLAESGARAGYSVGNWASKTAPGHAAVFTGAYGDVNGITGNAIALMPASDHTIVEGNVSGFSSESLMAEPFWITAARQGRRVVSLSSTQSMPFAMYLQPGFVSSQGLPGFGQPGYADRLWMVDGYSSRLARPFSDPAVIKETDVAAFRATSEATSEWKGVPAAGPYHEFELTLGDTKLFGLIYGQGGGSAGPQMALGEAKDMATATRLAASPLSATGTAPFSAPVAIRASGARGLVVFRLYELAADGSKFLLWRSSSSDIAVAMTRPGEAADLEAAAGLFTGNSRLLAEFGSTLPAGGDGTAERRYLETANLVVDWFQRATVWAIRQQKGDVIFTYDPYPDEGHHLWYGLLDESSPAYDAALAARLWPIERQMMARCDAFLGAVLDALEASGRRWNLVLFTDHGFMGVNKTFYPNRVLRQAGLLAADNSGNVLITGTQTLYALESSAFVVVNTAPDAKNHRGHKGGIVSDAAWEQAIHQTSAALLAARDPDTDAPIVTGVFRADQMRGMGIGGRHGGDLYLDLAPGYAFSADARSGAIVGARTAYASGDHIYFTFRDDLQGMAVFGGDGFRHLGRVNPIRSIDIAPTMAAAAGLEPPAQAQGHVLGELVAAPSNAEIRWGSLVPWAER